MADLNTDVRYIKGIGEQRAKALGKLGIATLRDLISYFPRAYDDRSALRRIADLVPGETAGVAAMVASPPTISHIRKGLDLVKLRAVDDTGTLDVTFFNQAWLKNSLHQGETYIFYGRAEGSLLRHQMANPVVEPEGRREVTGRIVPIYPLTAGVSQLILSRSIRQGLDACADILPDVLPDRVRQHHQLCRIEYAYENIHFPESAEALDLARRRLAFEELFLFTIGLERLRSRREVVHVPPCGGVDMELFYRALPFTLTDAQRRCVEEALADMRSGTPMNRLCQGDVGSGKTMVAAACVYFMVKNGRQAALMAPTEILAQQHYQGLAPLLENLGIRCALLTGSTTAKTKRSITQQLESGEIDFAIGTHALITGSVAYRDLGLVVTDEQHRFGVAQRAELAAKGDHPHILVMSATPIPRTLALILYGDLDVSIIDQLPPGMRESLYFKDDDERLSFLFGNYITMTNMQDHEIERIIKMHISPINISVHTTNPQLRVRMLANKRGGEVLKYLPRLVQGGIAVNCQLVLCRGINDGDELRRTLTDLLELTPMVQSVAAVPCGVTDYRQNLFKQIPYDAETSAAVIDILEEFGDECKRRHGKRIIYPSDEWYLKAGRPIPDPEFYEDYDQLENGVGMMSLFRQEFLAELDKPHRIYGTKKLDVVTGTMAAPLIIEMMEELHRQYPMIEVTVHPIQNKFFGGNVGVAGLVTATDIIAQCEGKLTSGMLGVPAVMLREEKDTFLDDVTITQLGERLGVKVEVLPVGGGDEARALLRSGLHIARRKR